MTKGAGIVRKCWAEYLHAWTCSRMFFSVCVSCLQPINHNTYSCITLPGTHCKYCTVLSPRLLLINSWWKEYVSLFPLSITLCRFWRQSLKHAGRFFPEISVKVSLMTLDTQIVKVFSGWGVLLVREIRFAFPLNSWVYFQASRSMLLVWSSRLPLILQTWRWGYFNIRYASL